MARPQHSSHSPAAPSPATKSSRRLPWTTLLLVAAASILISAFLYPLDDFDPAAIPADDYPFEASIAVPVPGGGMLAASERLGNGLVPGPEDFAYDGEEGFLYTSCSDGWIRRVGLHRQPPEVEDWAYVGGRPLGLALGRDRNLVVAESEKGLMAVKPDKTTILLTDEAEGLKFQLTDGVDVASNGIIFFTDASYKYSLGSYITDILEGRPHGRLLSFDPSTNRTVVLARDLYFPNGVSLSPDEHSLIFCETLPRRCRRYHIQGEKAGTVEPFIRNLPGLPDNIRYDGEDHYWIALASPRTPAWDMLMKYPFLRKLGAIFDKLIGFPHMKNSGVLKVSLEGRPLALYSDTELCLVTGGIKIGEHLYYGSLLNPYIGRINLTLHSLHAGLMAVKPDKTTILLTDEAEGLKFQLTDGVDVASNGIIFFTDASYKYSLGSYITDILEGRPHGRLLSFDPSTNRTVVLARDLYFPNGVSLSPDEHSLIFCETLPRRCRRYHIQGEKAGTVEPFIRNLPGLPDNIRYDGEDHYWIALASPRTPAWDMLMKYPFLRRLGAIFDKLIGFPHMKNSGVLKVSLEGRPLALYSDTELCLVTGGIKIGEHLYYGSLLNPYIGRINLTHHSLHAV